MLSIFAAVMILTFMVLIMTKKLSAMVALVLIPALFGVLLGHGSELGSYMIDGVKMLAPTGVMLIFAILYFGLMIDSGLFDPMVDAITRVVGSDPVRITVGTVLLSALVGLDGDGTTTYMITIAAMLPIYRRLGMDVRILACLAIMTSAVNNILPWGGPTARAATVLKLDPAELFRLAIPAMLITLLWVTALAAWFGVRERRRLAGSPGSTPQDSVLAPSPKEEPSKIREGWSRKEWFNLALTIALLIFLILGTLPLPILFILAFCIALTVNRPSLSDQAKQIAAHSGNALAVGGIVFAAGVFTGILDGTGMVDSISSDLVTLIPSAASPFFGTIIAVISVPLTYLISNDAFYFGTLPVLANTATSFGFTAHQAALASLVGQQFHLLSPLVPSTYLLVGMVGIDFGEHLKFTAKWALISCVVFLAALLLIGLVPVAAA